MSYYIPMNTLYQCKGIAMVVMISVVAVISDALLRLRYWIHLTIQMHCMQPWLERWAGNRKVTGSNIRADKMKNLLFCPWVRQLTHLSPGAKDMDVDYGSPLHLPDSEGLG